MGVMDKFLNDMKLNDSEYEDGDEDFYDDGEEEEPIAVKKTVKREYEEPEAKKVVSKVTPMKQKRTTSANGMEVCVIRPASIEDSREITETLLSNRTVVLNLEGLDVDIAQRIIDFTSGSCFAMRGNLQKISHYIFIVTPPSVDISGDFQDIISGSFDVPPIQNNL